ncbi:MAG: hypothetical protein ASARMPREDX12_006496 [Alectoria sarmentosa]|nr:MAG: hypothetical protein ASARMPRED_004231 [Alectoria sarmentosa]CAD6574292.1 MAG: hypothetical protein ASARMPREDX12_006496 [Alectoria sarmentosa]
MSFQALLLLLSITPFSSQAPVAKRAYSNGPVITSDFADPAFINVGGTYYAFATTNGAQNIQIATSPDFDTWTVTGDDALRSIPSWSTGETWAPDVIQIADGSFVLYFAAASSTNTNMHCVGTATSLTVEGPYTASDTAFACPLDQGGAIDPAGFTDSDGSLYVVYKVDGNSLGGGGTCGNGDGAYSTPIMLQGVEADGITMTGTATQILDRGTSDGPLIEAPSLVLVSGTYYLFFSSNCYNGPEYDTSYATASAVGGPYTKASSPLLVSGGDGGALNSPGSATVGSAGAQMVFHSDSVAGDSALRQMWTAGISIGGGVVGIS